MLSLQKLVGLVVVSEGQLESCEVEGREGCVLLVGGAGGGGGPLLQLWRGAELHEHSLRRALTDAHARAHHAPHGQSIISYLFFFSCWGHPPYRDNTKSCAIAISVAEQFVISRIRMSFCLSWIENYKLYRDMHAPDPRPLAMWSALLCRWVTYVICE